MKRYETKVIPPQPSREEKVCVGRTCDLCGFESKRNTYDWGAGSYEINRTEVTVTINHEQGTSYPESCNKTIYEIDICPKCFQRRLIPWLTSQGVQVQETEECW